MRAAIHGRTWRRGALALAAALAVCAAGAGVPAAADEPSERRSEPPRKADPREETAPAEEDAQRGRGITVLVPGWVPPADPRSFPTGITILRDPGADDGEEPGRPQVRIAVVPRPEIPLEDEPRSEPAPGEEGFDLVDQPGKVQPGAEQPPNTIGPTAAEQMEAFGRESTSGGSPVPEYSGWLPTGSFPDRPSDEPYPWNPAKFDELNDDVVWEPEQGFPKRDPREPYPWNQVRWDELPDWSTWEPQDAWGRKLGRAEVIVPWLDEDEAQPPDQEEGERNQ
jgi:hypothetical protein